MNQVYNRKKTDKIITISKTEANNEIFNNIKTTQ
jgi:hypothetical protein